MIDIAYDFAEAHFQAGKPIIGIMCEFTPREIIFAAGGLPVCLCGGSLDTIAEAETELPSNLCPLIKSTYGFCVKKSNPFLEWASLVVAETTCDGKKKMYELMSQHKPMFVLQLPQRSDDEVARAFWRVEIERLITHLEQQFSVEITDQKLRDAVRLMNKERSLRLKLAEYMRADVPPFSGRELLEFKSIISGIPSDLDAYKAHLESLENHIFQKFDKHDRPIRVLLTGVPTPHGAERVIDLIESSNGLIVAQENCTGLKPIMKNINENAPDIVAEIANFYYHLPCSVMTPNTERFERIEQLVCQYRADVVIDLIWQGCLTYDVESVRLKTLCEKVLNISYLKLVTDYSPADSERLKIRIEALFETVATTKN